VPAVISSTNPSCFLFLIDQSASMHNPFGGKQASKQKAEGAADAVNRLLQNLVIKCAKSEGIRDYYYVGVLGYGAEVKSAFKGVLANKALVAISQIADHPLRIEQRSKLIDDGIGGLVKQTIKFPVWFDPLAQGATPMCAAMHEAYQILSGWLNRYPHCFPPIVINMSDGAATDGDPLVMAHKLQTLASSDGPVLLFNINFSSHKAAPIEFPDTDQHLPGKYAKQLFHMSSRLPKHMSAIAQQEYGIITSAQTRGFTFHADMVALIKFLDIGTRPSHLD